MCRFLAKALLIASAIALSSSAARACNVPLFRYALERWRPDAYQLAVIHRGPLSDSQLAVVRELQKLADQPNGGPNLTLDQLDLAKVSKEDGDKLAKLYSLSQLPWLVVRYPGRLGDGPPAWQGPLMDAPLRELMDSPARRQIAERLLTGESAVWVFLESGDPTADNDAEAKLKTYLKNVEATRKLPVLTNSPKDKLLREDLPLRIAFSILRIRRDDPAEAMTVRLLLHSESDLAERKEPMVFPLFGRGIVLYALVGKGINEDTVGDAADLLVGACRCEIKNLNPGVDLLMTADWEGATVVTVHGEGRVDGVGQSVIVCSIDTTPPLFRNLLAVGLVGGAAIGIATVVLYILRLKRSA